MPKRGSWRCGCGAYNPAVSEVCESCGAIRVAQAEPEAASTRPVCRDCHEANTWTHLTRGEDGEFRCASCHLAHLKVQMAKPEDRCEDGITVAEKIREFRRIVTSNPWAERYASQREGPIETVAKL